MTFYTLSESGLAIHNRIFIACIARNAQVSEVLALLLEYGEVEEFDMPLGANRHHKGIAFVAFTTVTAAQDAVADLNGFAFHGRPMVVSEHTIDGRRKALIQVEIAKIDARHPPRPTSKPVAATKPVKKLAVPDLPSHFSRSTPWAIVGAKKQTKPAEPEPQAAPAEPEDSPRQPILPEPQQFVPLQTPDNDELAPPPYDIHAPPSPPMSPDELAGSLGFGSTEWQLHKLRVMLQQQHGIAPNYLFQPTEPHPPLQTC